MNENYVTLGQVCAKGSSNIAQKDLAEREGQYPIYGAAGLIKNVDFAHQKQPYIAVVKDGAGIGRVMKLPAYSSVIGTMQYIFPKENVDIDYLFYALQHMNLGKYFSGSTIPHIYFRDYQKERLKLPVMKVQQRQADTLSRIDALSAYGQRQIALMDEIVKSRFIELFDNTPYDSNKVYLDEISDFVTVGIANSATHAYAESGVVMLRNQNIKENYLDENDLIYITPDFAKKYGSKKLVENDILVIRTGYPGIACLVPKKYEGCQTFTTLIVRLKAPTLAHANYVCHYINSSFGKDYVEQSKVGVAQQNFGAKALARMPILIPPMEIQEQFAAFVAEVDKSKFRIQKSLSTSRKLWTMAQIDAIMNMDFSTQRSL